MKPDKPSILFVVEYYYPHVGGVEVLFKLIAEALAKDGYKATVVTCRLPGTPARETINGVEIRRVWVPSKGARYFFTFFGIFWTLPLAFKHDIVHTTTYNAALPAATAAWIARKPTILTVHETWDTLWLRLPGLSPTVAKVFRAFEKLILRLPYAKYVCVSHATEKALLALYPDLAGKVTTIYNGVDYSTFPTPETTKKPAGKPIKILYYGRPGISKGLENLVDAYNACTNPDIFLELVVSRDEHKRYDEFVERLTNPRASIEPSLPYPKLLERISAADYVIIPSLSEGFGFAALEACILGKTLICSNQASLPEVVSGDILFYNPWNPEDLTEILNNMPNVTFEHIPEKKFPIRETVRQYLELY